MRARGKRTAQCRNRTGFGEQNWKRPLLSDAKREGIGIRLPSDRARTSSAPDTRRVQSPSLSPAFPHKGTVPTPAPYTESQFTRREHVATAPGSERSGAHLDRRTRHLAPHGRACQRCSRPPPDNAALTGRSPRPPPPRLGEMAVPRRRPGAALVT